MVGQTYIRQSGPWFACEVRSLTASEHGEDLAMCAMRDATREYGVKPVPFDLLHSTEFRLARDRDNFTTTVEGAAAYERLHHS